MQMEMSEYYQGRCDHLLKRAEGGQWDPEVRLDWSQEMKLAEVEVQPPLISERLYQAWPGLAEEQRFEAVRMMLGSLLANLSVGEVFVDEALVALQDTLPHEKLKQIIGMQLIDENRHNSVLDRYVLDKLDFHQAEKSKTAAANLEAATAHCRVRWEGAALLVMILEIAATAAIQGMRCYCNEPLMQGMLKGVVGDESRHISGLTLALRAYMHNWDDDLREHLKEVAVCGWLQGLAVTERPACDMADLLETTYVSAPEVGTENWPFFRRTLADILVPKLKLLGLLDQDLFDRLKAAGCPLPVLDKVAGFNN